MKCRQWAVNGGGVGLTDSAVLIGDVRPRATTDLSGPAWPTFDVTIRLILLLSQTAVCLYLKASQSSGTYWSFVSTRFIGFHFRRSVLFSQQINLYSVILKTKIKKRAFKLHAYYLYFYGYPIRDPLTDLTNHLFHSEYFCSRLHFVIRCRRHRLFYVFIVPHSSFRND